MSGSHSSTFAKGDRVEVIRPSSHPRLAGALYPATVLRSRARLKNQVFVEFLTLKNGDSNDRLREYVACDRVRPPPPRSPAAEPTIACFRVGDAVDAYFESGWHFGVIGEVREGSRYLVRLESGGGTEELGVRIEFEQWELRVHWEWRGDHGDGSWSPPLAISHETMQEKSHERESKSSKIKVKIRCGRGTSLSLSPSKFSKGNIVEVSSDEKGYEGAWFSAIIVDNLGSDRYMVEYLTLKTDDETEALREETCSRFIRPLPPQLPAVCFKQLDKVDAWFNEGWWVGVISKILKGSKYVVYFSTSNEEMIFDKSTLRLHQDWIDDKWIIASTGDLTESPSMARVKGKMDESEKNFKVKYSKGMKVEVRSDEDGYRGSWFTASIFDLVGDDKYLVEYETLKTDDETELLREKAEASNIRPLPPKVCRVHRFAQLEMVDAWHNEGWWVGHISRILPGSKYTVYFRTSNEELVFKHRDLRPHQEWIGGRWIVASREHVAV